MPTSDDVITLTVPRAAVRNFSALSASLLDRMHELLERNGDGALNTLEREQLEMLVEMAQFGQLVASALEPVRNPDRAGH
jgi:hypothetical protein